jgi:hypothetical protein
MNIACSDTALALPLELTGELPVWPAASDTFRNCSGSAGVTTCLQDNSGAIGYIDSGHGISAGLEEVRLQNAVSGEFFHSQQATIVEAITTEKLPSSPTDDFSQVSFLNGGNGTTWPLILMTYLYVRTDLPSFMDSADEQSLLIAFLRTFFLDDYIKPCSDLFGFTVMNSLPEIKTYAEAAIDLVAGSVSVNATTWLFESKTNVINGAGPFVFSSKRKEIIDVNVNDLTTAVTDLEEQVDSLMTTAGLGEGDLLTGQLKQIQSEIDALQIDVEQLLKQMNNIPSGSSNNAASIDSSRSFTSQDATQLKAAIVLSILSFLFWVMWIGVYVSRYVKGS